MRWRRPRRPKRAGWRASRWARSTACRSRSRTSCSPEAGRRCADRRPSIRPGPWTDDAPAVARLRESGAVLIGKNTTPEFGWKGVTDSPLTGITRNPWNPAKTPGGSSGGGAAAVAAGMVSAHARHRWRRLDPDPVRVHRPLRPEAVVRPRAGVAAVAVRHGGAHRADDAHGARRGAAAERHRAARCARLVRAARRSRATISRASTTACADGASRTPPNLGYADVDPEVAALVKQAAMRFVDLGAQVEDVDPDVAGADEIFRRHWYLRRRVPAEELHAGTEAGDGSRAGRGGRAGRADRDARAARRRAEARRARHRA